MMPLEMVPSRNKAKASWDHYIVQNEMVQVRLPKELHVGLKSSTDPV